MACLMASFLSGCFDKQFESTIDIPKDVIITEQLIKLEIEKLKHKNLSDAEIKGVELLVPSLVSQVLKKYIDFKSKQLSNVRYKVVIFKGISGDFRITLPNQTIEFTSSKEKQNAH